MNFIVHVVERLPYMPRRPSSGGCQNVHFLYATAALRGICNNQIVSYQGIVSVHGFAFSELILCPPYLAGSRVFEGGDAMSRKAYCAITGSIFLVIAGLHLLRIVFGWSLVVEGWAVPIWLSWVALAVAGWLGYEGLKFARQAD